MAYCYGVERSKLFTEDGQVLFLRVRDAVQALLKKAGAFQVNNVDPGCGYDGWMFLACFDRLVELGEIKRVYDGGAGQLQVFIAGR